MTYPPPWIHSSAGSTFPGCGFRAAPVAGPGRQTRTETSASIRSIAPPDVFARSVNLFGGAFPSYRLFVIAFGLVVAGLLWLLLERTRLGAVIRAGVYDAEMAAGMGINIHRVFTGVFAFGAARGGLSGVIAGPIQSAQPPMGATILVPALIVVVVAGAIGTVFSVLGPKILGLATTTIFEGFLAKASGAPGAGIDFNAVGRILLGLVVLYLVANAFQYLMQYLMASAAQRTMRPETRWRVTIPRARPSTRTTSSISTRVCMRTDPAWTCRHRAP